MNDTNRCNLLSLLRGALLLLGTTGQLFAENPVLPLRHGDIDGNGTLDKLQVQAEQGTGFARVNFFLQAGRRQIGHGYHTLQNVKLDPKRQQWLVGDIDGDGRSEIIVIYDANGFGTIAAFDYPYHLDRQVFTVAQVQSKDITQRYKCRLQDVNGDGKEELLWCDRKTEQTRLVSYCQPDLRFRTGTLHF